MCKRDELKLLKSGVQVLLARLKRKLLCDLSAELELEKPLTYGLRF